jgi:hypothetical protein
VLLQIICQVGNCLHHATTIALNVVQDSDRDAPANCGKTKANGKGKPKHVTVPDPSAAAARYFELLVVTGCIGLYLGVQATDEVASKQRRRLLGGLTLLAGLMSCQGAIYVGLQEYVEMEQRPQSRVSLSARCSWAEAHAHSAAVQHHMP